MIISKRITCIYFAALVVLIAATDAKKIPKIGIIGGGIGGTSTAYFLRELFGDEATIDIYEKGQVGGRLATVTIEDWEYEVGGAIIHPRNMYMVNFTDILDLQRITNSGGVLGIWNGENMLIKTSTYKWIAMAQLFWRYKLDIYNIQSWVQTQLLNDFMRIYDIQRDGHAYTTVADILAAMNPKFVGYLKTSIKDLLKKAGYSDRFIDELVMGAMRTNYGQTTDIPAFVGAVSMAGVEHGLWSVKGGNKKVPELLVKQSKSNLIEGEVTTVKLVDEDEPLYEIDYKCKNCPDKNIKTREYDIIVVAKALHPDLNNIKFEGFPTPIKNFPQKFHKLTATMVKGVPNVTHFGIDSCENFPTELFTSNADVDFNSIGRHSPVSDESGPKVYKIFANKALSKEDISKYFTSEDDLRIVHWTAYPEYDFKADSLPGFVLHDKVYYVNSIELAASAMEMSAIGAKNVALLAYNHWTGNLDKIDEPHEPTTEKDKTEL